MGSPAMPRALCALLMALALACGEDGPRTPLELCESVDLCVDCTATCQRMLECSVGFADTGPSLPGVEDTDQARCERGCANTDTITPTRQRCILAADPSNTDRCHQDILVCLGVDGGSRY